MLENYASAWPRLGAGLIDFVVATVVAGLPALGAALLFAFALDVFLPGGGGENMGATFGFIGVFMLMFGGVYLAYHTFTTSRGGGVGKRMMRLRVVDAVNGANITHGRAFLRSLIPLGFWMYMNIGWWIDNLWCIWDPKKQTLHDKICGTIVIRAPAGSALANRASMSR